ncbi:MAG: GTP 3',8-cyclase MoaA [Nitrospirota bacterium]
MEDNYGRTIDYLRVSIIDWCNLHCIYCQPEMQKRTHYEILSYEEIIRIVRLAVQSGIKKIRITGGEPLMRKDITFFIKELSKIAGIEDLAMTTNGILLAKYACSLKEAGLQRLNISLDSLQAKRYEEITQGGVLEQVLLGMSEAFKANFSPIKINMVPMKGINDDELEDFVRLTIEKPVHVRFIELMPMNHNPLWKERYFPVSQIKERLKKCFALKPVSDVNVCNASGSGPAEYYQIDGAKGLVGFINPISEHFCSRCNRLRLTPDGKIRPCLESDTEIDIKTPIRSGQSDEEIKELLLAVVKLKPGRHQFTSKRVGLRQMSAIGG